MCACGHKSHNHSDINLHNLGNCYHCTCDEYRSAEPLLNKLYDNLAKSGLEQADYMAIIRLINRLLAD